MAFIQVRAAGKRTGNVVFDQAAGPINKRTNERARVIVRADGGTVVVDGSLKVVKDAIERGDLIDLSPKEPEPKAAPAPEMKK